MMLMHRHSFAAVNAAVQGPMPFLEGCKYWHFYNIDAQGRPRSVGTHWHVLALLLVWGDEEPMRYVTQSTPEANWQIVVTVPVTNSSAAGPEKHFIEVPGALVGELRAKDVLVPHEEAGCGAYRALKPTRRATSLLSEYLIALNRGKSPPKLTPLESGAL